MRYVTALVLTLLASGCPDEPSATPPSAAVASAPTAAAPYVAPQLDGVAECWGNQCTMHFAERATGNVDTLSLTRCFELGPQCALRTGKLTDAAQRKLRSLAPRLSRQKLEARYGCPGCADGPIQNIVVHHPDGHTTRHIIDPQDTDLPAELHEAGELLHALSLALGQCQTTELIVPEPGCVELMEKDRRQAVGVP